jgi:hypothetical protein
VWYPKLGSLLTQTSATGINAHAEAFGSLWHGEDDYMLTCVHDSMST